MIPGSHPFYRPDVDGLRAIGVLSVIGFHAASQYVPGGYVGVDVFFVISGFLISSIILKGLRDGSFSFADFYIRRIRRIFPALAVVLVATWMIGWAVLEPGAYALVGKHIAAGAAFVSNILLWRESGYFDPVAGSKPLLHLWSLGIEEQFYLFWPLFLAMAWKWGGRALLLIGAVFAASFAVNILAIDRYATATFYLPASRFWELSAGSALAYISLHRLKELDAYQSRQAFRLGGQAFLLRDIGAAIGLMLILGATFGLNEATRFPGWWALMPTLGAVLLIAAGGECRVNRTVLASRPMVFIGLISYPLYLWHWPLLVFARIAYDGATREIAVVIAVALSFALSIATYRFIERPLRQGFPGQGRLVASGLSGSIALVAAVGLITALGGGWSSRYPEAERQLFDYRYDYKSSFRSSRCLLSGHEKDFAAECAGEVGADRSKSMVLIWGDSHGAMLYGALEEVSRAKGFSVAQFTSSSCPPVLNFDKAQRPLCRRLNDATFQQIVRLRPETVILAHDWPQSVPENSLSKLPETVMRLRQAGVQRIVLVGPVPHWEGPLPVAVARHLRLANSASIPERMRYSLAGSIGQLDETLAETARTLSIGYVSSYRTFCNAEGCLVTVRDVKRIGDIGNPATGTGDRTSAYARVLTAFDESHLTDVGSRFWVLQNEATIFGR